MDTAAKTGRDDGKTASKGVVQKTAEATENLIGSEIADKITQTKHRVKKKKMKDKKSTHHQKKDSRLLMT